MDYEYIAVYQTSAGNVYGAGAQTEAYDSWPGAQVRRVREGWGKQRGVNGGFCLVNSASGCRSVLFVMPGLLNDH